MPETLRTERIRLLLDAACRLRGWNQAQLARALGRHRANLLPPDGDPRLTYLVKLAEALDWPIAELVGAIRGAGVSVAPEQTPDLAYDQAHERTKHALSEGRFTDALATSAAALNAASNPRQRTLAHQMLAGALDGLGLHRQAIAALRRGLHDPELPPSERAIMQANLAASHFFLGDHVIARGLLDSLVLWNERHPASDQRETLDHAFVLLVRGFVYLQNAYRQITDAEEALRDIARADLKGALDVYRATIEELAARPEDNQSVRLLRLRGFVQLAESALRVLDVESGRRHADEATEEILAALAEVTDLDAFISRPDYSPIVLESFGWACLTGGHIAYRHLQGPRRDKTLAILTNKGLEIADRLDNWYLRAKLLCAQYGLPQLVLENPLDAPVATSTQETHSLDPDDIDQILLTVARIPSFFEVGRQILSTAVVHPDPISGTSTPDQ